MNDDFGQAHSIVYGYLVQHPSIRSFMRMPFRDTHMLRFEMVWTTQLSGIWHLWLLGVSTCPMLSVIYTR